MHISSFVPEEVKTVLAVVLTWFYGVIGDNPIGFLASLMGLLYAAERYRTQKAERRLKEQKLKDILNDSE